MVRATVSVADPVEYGTMSRVEVIAAYKAISFRRLGTAEVVVHMDQHIAPARQFDDARSNATGIARVADRTFRTVETEAKAEEKAAKPKSVKAKPEVKESKPKTKKEE